MTATEELIAKQVSDVFPASVDDLPLADAARRGLIAPLRCLRVPPVAAINSVPIVGGDFEERALAAALDHEALNMAAATLYRERFDDTPGIVYAAGVDHAYNLATAFRAAGVKAEAVSRAGRRRSSSPTILAAYERGEIDVLINAMLLAEGWNSPRATVVMHLAPTASKRVYQQRIGRIMRIHPRKEAGIVVDFVAEGRDPQRARRLAPLAARRRLLPRGRARHAGAAAADAAARAAQADAGAVARPGHARRRPTARRDPARVAARRPEVPGRRRAAVLGDDRRTADALRRAPGVRAEVHADASASKGALETFLSTCAAQNPNRRLRLIALADRVSMRVDRADFDDLVTLVTQAPPWEKDRAAGVRTLLRAIAEGKPDAPEQILARWTWRLARAVRKTLDRKASQEYQDGKRLLGALANSRGHRHEENAARLVTAALEMPREVGAALLASAEGYTPRATQLIEAARERLGTIQEIAGALADDLPAPKTGPSRSRRRRRRKKKPVAEGQVVEATAEAGESPAAESPSNGSKPRRRRRSTPAAADADAPTDAPSPASE